MKTQLILVASMVLGLSLGASAQGKTETCPPSSQSSQSETIQPYGVVEESGTELNQTDFHSTEADINLHDEAVEVESDASLNTDMENKSRIHNAASSTGSAVKSGASKVGNAAEKGGKKVYKGTKKAGKKVGNGAKEGWKETKQHTPGTDAHEMHKEGLVD